MTLPPNCLPPEPSATPCDMHAACGVPAQSPDAAAAPGTPFASLLGQADATVANAPAVGTEAVPTPPPARYPATYYMTQIGTAQMQSQMVEVGTADISPVEEPRDVSKGDESSSDKSNAADGSMVLAYEFIAGQWLQQPPAPEQVSAKNMASKEGADLSVTAKTGETPFSQPVAQIFPDERASARASDAQNTRPDSSPAVAQAKTAGFPEQAAKSAAEPIAAASQKTPASSIAQLVASTLPGTEKAEVAPQFLQENTTPSAITETSANGGGTQNSNQQFAPSRPALLPTQEKIAAPGASDRSESVSGGNSSTGTKEKKSLFVNGEDVTTSYKKIGTGAANREIAMSSFATNKSPSVDLSTLAADGIRQKTTSETTVDTQLSAQAPRLVQEIRTIADRIASIDRNTVEVRFDFSDTERLSVRVEYREGAVHTTFKTDSSQLRDVVAQEWQAQNASAEQRSYRLADPVFTQTASDRQNFAGGDSSGRQRAFEQQAQSGAPSFASAFSRSGASTTSVASPAARTARPETSLHLHALA